LLIRRLNFWIVVMFNSKSWIRLLKFQHNFFISEERKNSAEIDPKLIELLATEYQKEIPCVR